MSRGRGGGNNQQQQPQNQQQQAPRYVDPAAQQPQQQVNNNNGRGGGGGGGGRRGGGSGGGGITNDTNNQPQQQNKAQQQQNQQQQQQQQQQRQTQQQTAAPAPASAAATNGHGNGNGHKAAASSLPADSGFYKLLAQSAVCAELLLAISEKGYKEPTEIQSGAIPKLRDGRDVCGQARTGSGKTLAFSLPILERFATRPPMIQVAHNSAPSPRALVLAPTRELASQIEDSFTTYGKYLGRLGSAAGGNPTARPVRSVVIFGGVGQGPQVTALRTRPDVLVACPGRLLDLYGQGCLSLDAVEIFVLDEADRMLDSGFLPECKKIIAKLPANHPRQNMLFSATFPAEIKSVVNDMLRNPVHVAVSNNETAGTITSMHYLIQRDSKVNALVHLLQSRQLHHVLIFTRTKATANKLTTALTRTGLEAYAMHGNKSQGAREQALGAFKKGTGVLVATDIAARGLDIQDLPCVIQFDLPNVPADFVHRTGRTGRAGKSGVVVSLVTVDELGFFDNIQRFTSQVISVGPADSRLEALAPSPQEMASPQPLAMGRQTLWGGRGPMPSKAVMDAAGRVARREIAQQVAERKAGGGAAGGGGRGGGRGGGNNNSNGRGGGARQPAPQSNNNDDDDDWSSEEQNDFAPPPQRRQQAQPQQQQAPPRGGGGGAGSPPQRAALECFGCGGPHMARDCPQRQQQGGGGPQRGGGGQQRGGRGGGGRGGNNNSAPQGDFFSRKHGIQPGGGGGRGGGRGGRDQ